jgi:hypothetical protein
VRPAALHQAQLRQRVASRRDRRRRDDEHAKVALVDEALDRLIVLQTGREIRAVEEDVVTLRQQRVLDALGDLSLFRRIAQEDLQQ